MEALRAENAAQARRIAELEAKVAQLEKRPVLEADVLASFSAFDANGDGYLTSRTRWWPCSRATRALGMR